MLSDIKGKIGEDIRRIRLARRWTLKEFCHQYEAYFGHSMSTSSLSKYERGLVRVSAETYENIKSLEELTDEYSYANSR